MENIAAREAKIHFGELLDTAQREPVTIEKYGRPVAVIMSSHEYEELKLARLRSALKEAKKAGLLKNYSIKRIINQLDNEQQ